MAASQIETVGSGIENAKLAASVLLVLAGLAGFYYASSQGVWVQWSLLIVGVALGVGVFLISESGKQLIGFGRESWRELSKVVWPARKEAMTMTAYVFGFVVIMALFLWLTDKTLEWVFYDLILGWKK
jgi:preprotein translocase subunit SecE